MNYLRWKLSLLLYRAVFAAMPNGSMKEDFAWAMQKAIKEATMLSKQRMEARK